MKKKILFSFLLITIVLVSCGGQGNKLSGTTWDNYDDEIIFIDNKYLSYKRYDDKKNGLFEGQIFLNQKEVDKNIEEYGDLGYYDDTAFEGIFAWRITLKDVGNDNYLIDETTIGINIPQNERSWIYEYSIADGKLCFTPINKKLQALFKTNMGSEYFSLGFQFDEEEKDKFYLTEQNGVVTSYEKRLDSKGVDSKSVDNKSVDSKSVEVEVPDNNEYTKGGNKTIKVYLKGKGTGYSSSSPTWIYREGNYGTSYFYGMGGDKLTTDRITIPHGKMWLYKSTNSTNTYYPQIYHYKYPNSSDEQPRSYNVYKLSEKPKGLIFTEGDVIRIVCSYDKDVDIYAEVNFIEMDE